MRPLSRHLLIAATLAAPIGLASPVVSPAGAQVAKGYFDVPQIQARQSLTDARNGAKTALSSGLSYKSLASGDSDPIKIKVTGVGNYRFIIARRVGTGRVTLAQGTGKVTQLGVDSVSITFTPTKAGRAFFERSEADSLDLQLETRFNPAGDPNTYRKRSNLTLDK